MRAKWMAHSGAFFEDGHEEIRPMQYPKRYSWGSIAVAIAFAALIGVYAWNLAQVYLVGWAG